MPALRPSLQQEQERRYILGRAEAEGFIAAIAHHLMLDAHHRTFPVAYTRTTYLDSDDFAYLRSCDGPVGERLRIREYAAAPDFDSPPSSTGRCFLELKQSAGPVRAKRRFAAPAEVIWQMVRSGGEVGGERKAASASSG